jgi:hypothetical protein
MGRRGDEPTDPGQRGGRPCRARVGSPPAPVGARRVRSADRALEQHYGPRGHVAAHQSDATASGPSAGPGYCDRSADAGGTRCPGDTSSRSAKARRSWGTEGPTSGRPWPGASPRGKSASRAAMLFSVGRRSQSVKRRGGASSVHPRTRPRTDVRSTVSWASPVTSSRSLGRKKAIEPGVCPGTGTHVQSGRPGGGSAGSSPRTTSERLPPVRAPSRVRRGGSQREHDPLVHQVGELANVAAGE